MEPHRVCKYLPAWIIHQILKAHVHLVGLKCILTEDLRAIRCLSHSARKGLWGCSILVLRSLNSIHVLAHQCLIWLLLYLGSWMISLKTYCENSPTRPFHSWGEILGYLLASITLSGLSFLAIHRAKHSQATHKLCTYSLAYDEMEKSIKNNSCFSPGPLSCICFIL